MLRAAARRGASAARQAMRPQAGRNMSSKVSHEEEMKEMVKWKYITFTGGHPSSSVATHWPAGSQTDRLTTAQGLPAQRCVHVLAALPICAAYMLYELSKSEHEHEHDGPVYPYMRIRSKEFPWGTARCST